MKKADNKKFCLIERKTATGVALEIWRRVKTGWKLVNTKHVDLREQPRRCSRRIKAR